MNAEYIQRLLLRGKDYNDAMVRTDEPKTSSPEKEENVPMTKVDRKQKFVLLWFSLSISSDNIDYLPFFKLFLTFFDSAVADYSTPMKNFQTFLRKMQIRSETNNNKIEGQKILAVLLS